MSYLNTPETLIRFCQSNNLKLLKIQRMPIISATRWIWALTNTKSLPLMISVSFFTICSIRYSKRNWNGRNLTAGCGKTR